MRFDGFNKVWESKQIGEIAEVVGGGTPKTEIVDYWDGEIKWFTPSEIGKTKYVFDSDRHITEKGLKNSSAKLLPKDALLLSSRATVGEISIALTECSTNQGFQSLITKSNVDNDFIYYLISTIKNEFLRRSSGSTFLEINKNEIKRMPINIPELSEQKKISNLFSAIDNKIEMLEKKCEYYQDFKKYLMQRIFSSSDDKLRFNFTDDWNYMNFSEIFKSVSTKKYQIKSADILDKGDFEVIDQGQDEIAGYFNDKTKLCQELPIIIYGDHTTFVKFRDKPFIVGADGVKLLIPKFNANPKYLFYALEHFNIKPEGYKRHFSIIKKIKLPIPTLEEQNEISEIFTYIDIKLKYTKIQLQETEEFKKGLLQQMFIVRINWRCNFKLAKSPSFNKHLLILKNKIIFIIIK